MKSKKSTNATKKSKVKNSSTVDATNLKSLDHINKVLKEVYPSSQKGSIGDIARISILQKKNFVATLATIKKSHKGTEFTIKCYYSYRQDMKRHGMKLPVVDRTVAKGKTSDKKKKKTTKKKKK